MRFVKANLSALLVISTGLIAILLLLIFPAAIHDMYHFPTGNYRVESIDFWGFIFGYVYNIITQYPANGTPYVSSTNMYDGAISIFGVIFFVFLVLSLILVILSIVTKRKILEIIGSILMILSGICIFLLLDAGTDVVRINYSKPFHLYFNIYKLSASVIIIGIITILTGAFSCISYFRKFLIKPKFSTFIMLGACALALVSAILLPGLIHFIQGASGHYFEQSYNLWGLMVGHTHSFTTWYASRSGTKYEPSYTGFLDGGMSIFGLISLILLIVSICLIIISLFAKNKKFNLIASILLLIAGLLVFALPVVGTDITSFSYRSGAYSFNEYYFDCRLGVGTIVYGITSMIGGLIGVFKQKFILQDT